MHEKKGKLVNNDPKTIQTELDIIAKEIDNLFFTYREKIYKELKESRRYTPKEIATQLNKRNKELYLNYLESELKIKIRFVPQPGYKFNKEKLEFEKIN
jgi:hypothetical protein